MFELEQHETESERAEFQEAEYTDWLAEQETEGEYEAWVAETERLCAEARERGRKKAVANFHNAIRKVIAA